MKTYGTDAAVGKETGIVDEPINMDRSKKLGADHLKTSRTITDRYSSRIMVATSRVAKSVQQLAIDCDIPIAQCYRRIKELKKLELIEVVNKFLTRDGKRVNLYRSRIHRAQIIFEKGRWRVDFLMNDGARYDYGTGGAGDL